MKIGKSLTFLGSSRVVFFQSKIESSRTSKSNLHFSDLGHFCFDQELSPFTHSYNPIIGDSDLNNGIPISEEERAPKLIWPRT